LLQHTKTGKNKPNNRKLYQMATQHTKWLSNIPNGHKISQLFQLQSPPKYTPRGIFGLEIYSRATLIGTKGTCQNFLGTTNQNGKYLYTPDDRNVNIPTFSIQKIYQRWYFGNQMVHHLATTIINATMSIRPFTCFSFE
jgi:hypothetical protein